MSADSLDDLRARALHARQRLDLYRAKAYGPRLTSPVRMRELQRESDAAQARLEAAVAQQRRADEGEQPAESE